ncbi:MULTISPECIES: hypothetical protein [unclassified Polaribacter]|uniref:hypothetical protein n=1 Tax=unclassified Polaribacter TaxID=196858 RepID=UPI0011BF717D|nr:MULTISPECIES: hypothetical protein [unclassified Polaribacter]TXD51853.1 hypothetical protein ES043_10200 [Polaribacter sp. IC063]TXD59402.1 hypothetical protein ES044_10265 [Polaribacter sp. IC066]
MKKIFLLIAVVSLTLMSFSESNSNSVYTNESSIIEIQIIDDIPFTGEVNCKWRTCLVYGDGSKTCGEWTRGKCNKDDKGVLTKI